MVPRDVEWGAVLIGCGGWVAGTGVACMYWHWYVWGMGVSWNDSQGVCVAGKHGENPACGLRLHMH
eukprot:8555437-Prorocentrum_lima.AAC.1